jgi:signal transduction histidine kinase/CheY-like chemotaxis protein
MDAPLCAELPRIFIPNTEQKQPLTVQLEYLDDPEGTYTIEQVLSHTNEFKNFDTSTHNFDYVKKVLWIRFSVDLTHYQEPYWFLIQNYEHVTDIKLYLPSAPDMEVMHWSEQAPVGYNLFENTRTPMFMVPKPDVAPAVYYMRYSPQGHWLSVDLSWASVYGIIELTNTTQMVFGLFFGGLLVMWLYNFVLFLYLRDRIYFYYLYYLASVIGYFFYRNGYAPIFVQLTPLNEKLFTLCAFTAVHGIVLFARKFLTLNKSIPWIDNYLRFGQWAFVIGGILVFILPLGRPIQVISYLISAFVPALLVAGPLRWRQGYEPARVYTIGWTVFGLALCINAMRQVGIIDTNVYTMYLLQFGSALEAVFFALAIAYRIKLIDQATATAKTAFLGMISHELKTPLQGIFSSIDLLSIKMPPDDVVMKRLKTSTDLLEIQIKDLTDYALLENGKLQFQKRSFNASKLARKTVEEFRPIAERKGLQLRMDIEDDLLIFTDMFRIQQILNNLISNAIKYTQSGYVEVSMQHEGLSPLNLVIRVSDSGIGFDKKNMKAIFEPFTQIDQSSTRKHDGIGMGLAVVQKLIALFHGTIKVESELGKGSVFIVSLPVEKSEEDIVDDSEDNLDQEKMILLVDDNQQVRETLKPVVEQIGYNCQTADGGYDALKLIKKNKYTVILLDVNMPDIDGFEVASQIRGLAGSNRSIPIIWISATPPELITEEQKKLFTHFLEKPVRSKQLKDMLDKIIG